PGAHRRRGGQAGRPADAAQAVATGGPAGVASGAAARADHEATKHSLVRLRASRHRLDWSNQPLPDKVYRTLAPHPEGTRLPREFRPSERPALDVIRSAAEEPR